MQNRRSILSGLAALIAGITTGSVLWPEDADAGPRARKRRRVRRKVKRRVRRRHRRRVVSRRWRNRRRWVVPVALVVGWELAHEDRIVVVKEIKVIEVEGESTEAVITTEGEEILIEREDDDTNGKAEQGSTLPENDTKTPAVETDEEVEIEVEVEE